MSNYPFSNINPDQRRTVSMCLCVSWGPNDMGVHQRSPPNSLNSSIDLSPRVRGTESKKGPKIYKIHKSFEPNKLTRMSDPGLARLSDPGPTAPSLLPVSRKDSETIEEPARKPCPAIQVDATTTEFRASTLREMQSDWLKNITTRKTTRNNFDRERRLNEMKQKEREKFLAIELERRRRKHEKWVRFWRKCVNQVIESRRERKRKTVTYLQNTSKAIMQLYHEKKRGKVDDQYKVLSSDFERVLAVKDWRRFEKREFNLEEVMDSIAETHHRKIIEDLRNAVEREEKEQLMRELEKLTQEAQMDAEREFSGAENFEAVVAATNMPPENQPRRLSKTLQRRDSREELISKFLKAQYQKQKVNAAFSSSNGAVNNSINSNAWKSSNHSGVGGSNPDSTSFAPIIRKPSVTNNKLVMDIKCTPFALLDKV